MTLPRFTSGRVGNLEFQHLNETFDRLDALDGRAERPVRRSVASSGMILAYVKSYSGTGISALASFDEYALDALGSSVYVKVDGGVTSKEGTDEYATPIVYPVPPIGSIVPIFPHVAKDGKLYFKAIDSEGTSGRIGKVMGGAQIVANKSWLYTLKNVAWDYALNQFTELNGDFEAINGCENRTDDLAARRIGVGTIYPQGANAVRKQIAQDVVVTCVKTAGPYVFSVPNGYEFTCT